MKRKLILLFFLLLSLISYSQKFFSGGTIPAKTFLVGYDFGGTYITIEADYSITGKKMHIFDLRSVPKIAYAPIKNILFGFSYYYEFFNVDGLRERTNFGYGGFIRCYLPFFNRFFKINKSRFLNNRLFLFSEIYLERNNLIKIENKDTAVSENLNTLFYGAKLGANFRLFNRLYANISFVQNFDNQNGNFKSFHKELGFEYVFNFNNKQKEK